MSVFVAVHLDDRGELSRFPEVGLWFDYYIYEFSDDLAPRLNLPAHNPVIIPNKEIAYAWKFAGVERHHIKPRTFKNAIRDQLDEYGAVYEPYKEGKDKYTFSEEDIKNAIEFMKIILHAIAARGYETIWSLEKPQMSKLYVEFDKKGVFPQVDIKKAVYNKKLQELVGRMSAMENRIDSISTIAEGNAVLYDLVVDLNPAAVV